MDYCIDKPLVPFVMLCYSCLLHLSKPISEHLKSLKTNPRAIAISDLNALIEATILKTKLEDK